MISTKEKGITLIALIITIIVMLILVAVTVNVALNGGLFDQAKKAKYQTEVSVIKDFVTEKSATLVAEDPNNDILNGLTSLEQLDIDQELKDKYKDKLEIHDGVLYYDPEVVTNEEEREWLEQIDVYPYREIPDKATLKIGDYVAYGPAKKGGEVSYWHVDEAGYSTTGISRDMSVESGGWRVLKIDGDKITLISATASNPDGRLNAGEDSSGRLLLKGQQIYNNGVEISNRICDVLYTIDGVGKARSINLNDINDLVGYTEPATKTYKLNSNNLYYPARYADDNGSAIDTDTFKTDGFSRHTPGVNTSSEYVASWNLTQGLRGTQLITGYGIASAKAANSLSITDNSYEYNISDYTDNDIIKELVLGSSNYPQNTYWIASRLVHYNGDAWFTIAYCDPGQTNNITYDRYPYTSTNYGAIIINEDGTDNRGTVKNNQRAHFVRPVIELDASKIIDTTITDTTDGSFEHPWPIANK